MNIQECEKNVSLYIIKNNDDMKNFNKPSRAFESKTCHVEPEFKGTPLEFLGSETCLNESNK